ncbi:GTP 3',8-cyclase MoaA [Arcanobacterium canis]
MTGINGRNDLIDSYGRVARDLRVSLTDRCNLRCQYCMPSEGVKFMPTDEVLTDDEVVRLVTLAVSKLGVTRVRFTGGEPLMRRGLENIVAATAALRTPGGDSVDISLTTNALGLDKRAARLHESGLRRVNISLDSATGNEYADLTRRHRFDDAMAGIREAIRVGLSPVKINTVVMPGVNDQSVEDLVLLGLSLGVTIRFIEFMPIGVPGAWQNSEVITSRALRERLEQHFELSPTSENRGSSPAEVWDVAAGSYRCIEHPAGKIGFISSVTAPFCGDCDRTRLTADGNVRSCLFSDEETSLRDLMRSGATDSEIAHAWRQTMWGKPFGHGINTPEFTPPSRPMSAIGG